MRLGTALYKFIKRRAGSLNWISRAAPLYLSSVTLLLAGDPSDDSFGGRVCELARAGSIAEVTESLRSLRQRKVIPIWPRGVSSMGYDSDHSKIMTSPLICAAASHENNSKMIKALLSLGLGVNDTDEFGNTALHFAAKNGSVANVDLLLTLGAKINHRNTEGETPLMSAIEPSPSMEAILRLANSGSDFFATTNYGCSPALVFEDHRRYLEDVCKNLLAKTSPEELRRQRDQAGYWPSTEARQCVEELPISQRVLDILKRKTPSKKATAQPILCAASRLLPTNIDDQANLNPNMQTPNGRNILHLLASRREHADDALDYWLKRGTDINQQDKDGITPLMLAQSSQVATLFLSAGANPLVQDKLGRTALMHAAARYGDPSKIFGDSWPGAEILDNEGRSVLMYCSACDIKTKDSIKFYRSQWINLDAEDKQGYTFRSYIFFGGAIRSEEIEETAEQLNSYGVSFTTSDVLLTMVLMGSEAGVLNYDMKELSQPFSSRPGILNILLSKPEIPNKHLLLKHLIKAGANPNRLNDNDENALMVFAHTCRTSDESEDILNQLVRARASSKGKNKLGFDLWDILKIGESDCLPLFQKTLKD